MSIITLASSTSVYRGYEYYQDKRVINLKKLSETEYSAAVKGSKDKEYDVFIDIEHPRKSHCNCPHANGRRVICKHMVALYFAVFPEEAKKYIDDMHAFEEELEREFEELERAVEKCILKMSKPDLQNVLLELLLDGPDWQYDKFVREYVD